MHLKGMFRRAACKDTLNKMRSILHRSSKLGGDERAQVTCHSPDDSIRGCGRAFGARGRRRCSRRWPSWWSRRRDHDRHRSQQSLSATTTASLRRSGADHLLLDARQAVLGRLGLDLSSRSRLRVTRGYGRTGTVRRRLGTHKQGEKSSILIADFLGHGGLSGATFLPRQQHEHARRIGLARRPLTRGHADAGVGSRRPRGRSGRE